MLSPLRPARRRRPALVAGIAALCLALPSGVAVAATPASGALPHPVGGFLPPTQRIDAAHLKWAHDAGTLPERVDLGANLPGVGDQGQVASCVAWTIAHSLMGWYANRSGAVGAPYAPLYLYLRVVARGGAPTVGLYPEQALTEARTSGVDTQDDYAQGTTAYQTAPTAAEIANARNYKLTGWTTLWTGARQGVAAQNALKQALAAGSPVAIGLPVFPDFELMPPDTLYNTLTGRSLGGHMVTAYKYDAQGVWIRNQWGSQWGTGGDAHLSWAFIQADVSAAYTVAGIATPVAGVPTTPAVTALSPTTGRAGSAVLISGSGLGSATGVSFGGVPATFTPVQSNGVTQLWATVPDQAAATLTVTVTNPAGTSPATAASRYTLVPPPPTVTGLDTARVTVFGGQLVTVTGTGLGGVTAVKVGAASGTAVRSLGDNAVQFVAPVNPVGSYDVQVTNRYGTSPVTPADRLSYVNPPAPVLTSVSPDTGTAGRSAVVYVTGTDLRGATRVTSGGISVSFTRVSDNQLRVGLPAHPAGPVDIRVTTPGGSNPTGTTFSYLAPSGRT